MEYGVRHARIYTGDPALPHADSAIVRDGRFVFVGSSGDRDGAWPAQVHDLGGATVLPGLVDSHTHPGAVASSRWHIALPRFDDVDDLLSFVRDYAREHPPAEAPFLYFEYYHSDRLFGDATPTKELLDTAVTDRPVLCQESGDHSCWVNSSMLTALGVDRDTPDPVADLVTFRRAADGELTGIITENAWHPHAEAMWTSLGWRPPETVTEEDLAPVLDFLCRCGVTAVFDAILIDEDTLRVVSALDARGELGLYYQGAPVFHSRADLDEVLSTVHRYQADYGNDHIRVDAVKLFLDGTNELGNSAVLQPLSHGHHDRAPGHDHDHGAIRMDTDELTECLLACNAAGVDLHIHMVGDRAFRTGCDAVEAARQRATGNGQDWYTQVTFAHCELVDPADMPRPAQLGIFVNWTAHWSGGYFGEDARRFLGDERWNRMYAFNEIADHGAVVTFSSDVITQYELHRGAPFFGMQVARTRIDPEEPLDPQRYPSSVRPAASSSLTLERLIRGYTIDGARQMRLDDVAGSVSPGKAANFVVLDRDPFETPDDRIAAVTPTAVVFEGELRHGSLGSGRTS